MRLSKKFLSDYIDISDLNYSELADKMVFAGNEYESISKLCDVTNLVVGEVIECVDHPNSDHLHICQVNIGDEVKQIVCGAPNVRSNIKVIVAKIGAVLPGGFTIKEANLAGTKSEGMICSLEELGLESKYLKEEDKTGIHVLDNDAIVGEDALKHLEFDDEIIDFELTANRADLLSVLGMAYEVGAIYNRKITLPNIECEEKEEDINDTYSLNVQTSNCPIYLGKLVKNVKITESPKFIKARLMASGIRPINNVVDISNYVMLEYGQPLHFFDADKLGKNVVVRMANEEEKITTLDGVERDLKTTDIVIADDNNPVALAGVMGGLSTEVENDTVNIFIESAIFNSYNIRMTSKSILRSEASNRYEKGVDPSRTEQALKRACYLLQKYAGGEVTKGILTHDKVSKDSKKIEITLEKINSILGINLTKEEVANIFERLEFAYYDEEDKFTVMVPTRRIDINIKEDLIEEIGRIYGYEHIESSLPIISVKRGSRSYKANLSRIIRNQLSGLGLNQVVTYSLTSEEKSNLFVDKEYNKVYLLSPMSEDKKVMRTSIIPSLIDVYDYNISRNIKDINIFEIGSIYYKEEDYVEQSRIAGLLSGTYQVNTWQNNSFKVDFYLLKGIIENLLNYLGYNNRYQFTKEDILKDYHPGKSCTIKIDNEIVGYMGAVHPKISKKEIYVFEINLDKLITKKVRSIKYKEISKFPAVNKDLAFVVDKKVPSSEIYNILKRVGGRLLESIDVFDVYEGENVKENEKSIAYSLTFKNNERTLTDEEVTEIFNKMISEVENKIGAKLRNK